MTTPYIGFGNDQLDKLPKVDEGQMIECLRCGEDHLLICGLDTTTGEKSCLLMYYECEGKTYLGAVNDKLVNNVKPVQEKYK